MYKFPLIFLLALFCCICACAQTGSYTDTAVVTSVDTATYPANDDNYITDPVIDTVLRFRAFSLNKDSLHAWQNEKEYGWIKNLDSLLKNEQNRTRPKTQYIKKRDHSFGDWLGSGVLNIFFWVVAGMMLAFIIYRLFLSKGLFGRQAKKAVKENPDEAEAEDISGKDFNPALNKAYSAGDCRTATRCLFLMTLQKLDVKELIRFGADKTNTAYLNELPQVKREDFASLSLYYEYIWYGKAPLQKETFDMIRVKFNDFLSRI